MTLEIKSLKSDLKEDFRIVALVQGESGSGKTTLGSTFPAPIFLDCDDNLQGVADSHAKSIRLCDISEALFMQEYEAGMEIASRDPWCKTIVLDSLSTFSHMLMTNIQIRSKSYGKVPNQHDYLTQMSYIKQTIMRLKRTGKNVVLTCHINIDKNEVTGKWRALPLVTGKLAQQIGGLFQENWMMFNDSLNGKGVFKLKSIGDEVFSAKSLIILPEHKNEILDPSYSKIIESSKYANLIIDVGETPLQKGK